MRIASAVAPEHSLTLASRTLLSVQDSWHQSQFGIASTVLSFSNSILIVHPDKNRIRSRRGNNTRLAKFEQRGGGIFGGDLARLRLRASERLYFVLTMIFFR